MVLCYIVSEEHQGERRKTGKIMEQTGLTRVIRHVE
jgi:hypothetical protein